MCKFDIFSLGILPFIQMWGCLIPATCFIYTLFVVDLYWIFNNLIAIVFFPAPTYILMYQVGYVVRRFEGSQAEPLARSTANPSLSLRTSKSLLNLLSF